MFVGFTLIASVGLVDAYFVGKLGTDAQAAFGFAFPASMLVMALLMGFAAGVTSTVSRALGRGDRARAKAFVITGIAATALVTLGLGALVLLLQGPMWRMLGVSDSVLPLVESYLLPLIASVVFVSVPVAGTAALRSLGETRSSAGIMMAAAVLNAGLDPLLIFGWGPVPALGLAGAAVATMIANAIGVVVTLWMVSQRVREVLPGVRATPLLRGAVPDVLRVSFPAMLGNGVGRLSLFVVTPLVAQYGSAAVAGYAVVTRIEMMAFMMPLSIASALEPFVGQNWGAQKWGRAREATRLARRFAAAAIVLLWVVFLFTRENIALAFASSAEAQATIQLALLILPLGIVGGAMTRVSMAAFNAIGRSIRTTYLAGLFGILFIPIFCYSGSHLFGLPGLFGGVVVSAWLSQAVATWWLHRDGLGRHSPAPDASESPDTPVVAN